MYVTCSVQVISITSYSAEAVSWKTAPTVGMVGGGYIQRSEDGGEEPSMACVQLTGQLEALSS